MIIVVERIEEPIPELPGYCGYRGCVHLLRNGDYTVHVKDCRIGFCWKHITYFLDAFQGPEFPNIEWKYVSREEE